MNKHLQSELIVGMGSGSNSADAGVPAVPAARRLAGLFTKEDNFNIHKTFGLGCLIHFLYRFAFIGAADMRFASSYQTLGCMAWHFALSTSSLIFKIPTKRIAEGSRIWPEYRLHSIVFACRSIACMLVVWAEDRLGVATPWYNVNAAIVIATLLAADFSTWWVGPNGRSSTIQELDAPPPMRYFFSVMQFHATAGCLVGVRRFSTQFFYVWIIQFTAFLMTLRRKNLAPHGPLVVTYGVMLTAGFCISTYDHFTHGSWLLVNTLANAAAALRLAGGLNKYVLWGGLGAVLQVVRPHLVVPAEDPYLIFKVGAWLVTVAAIVLIGVRKVKRDYKRDSDARVAATSMKPAGKVS